VLAYGDFITIVINFLIVAIALFAVIRGINTLNRKPKDAAPAAPPPTPEVVLLTQIRDLLAKR
jgi:large conductance mechanosensitive channel